MESAAMGHEDPLRFSAACSVSTVPGLVMRNLWLRRALAIQLIYAALPLPSQKQSYSTKSTITLQQKPIQHSRSQNCQTPPPQKKAYMGGLPAFLYPPEHSRKVCKHFARKVLCAFDKILAIERQQSQLLTIIVTTYTPYCYTILWLIVIITLTSHKIF